MIGRCPARSRHGAALAALLLGAAVLGAPAAGVRAETDAAADSWEHLAATPGSDESDDIRVRTARAADGAVQVEATLALAVGHDVVWDVLTDYENMPRFVPDLVAARVVASAAGSKRVALEGVARLLFMEFPITTTVDTVYDGTGSIAIDSVAGNLAIHGVVRVRDDAAGTRVDYRARITPDFWLPPVIGHLLIGRQIRRQFEGVVAEMHRRAGARQTRGPVRLPPGPLSAVRHQPDAPLRAASGRADGAPWAL
jgi:carbon monoxide dehydrogenase subunit G